MDGHLAHGMHMQIRPWIEDSVWVFGIAAGAVVGIRGGFPGARITGLICLGLIVFMVIPPGHASPLGIIATIVLLPISVFHAFKALLHRGTAKLPNKS